MSKIELLTQNEVLEYEVKYKDLEINVLYYPNLRHFDYNYVMDKNEDIYRHTQITELLNGMNLDEYKVLDEIEDFLLEEVYGI